MSVYTWIHHAQHYGLLGTRDMQAVYGTVEAAIQIYDIGEKEQVGALYPDKSRQAQPITWYDDGILRKMRLNQRGSHESKALDSESMVTGEKASGRPRLARPAVSTRPRILTASQRSGSGQRPRVGHHFMTPSEREHVDTALNFARPKVISNPGGSPVVTRPRVKLR